MTIFTGVDTIGGEATDPNLIRAIQEGQVGALRNDDPQKKAEEGFQWAQRLNASRNNANWTELDIYNEFDDPYQHLDAA